MKTGDYMDARNEGGRIQERIRKEVRFEMGQDL